MTRNASVTPLAALARGSALVALLMMPPLADSAAAQSPPASHNAGDDRAAVIGMAEALLRAISTRDTALARRVMAPGAQLVAASDPPPTSGALRLQSDTAFLRTIGGGTTRYLERMWEAQAIVKGTIALVHAPYDFHIDGRFSHCGTDTFTLAKGPDGWRITQVAYTVQRTGCAPSPLGAPAR